jgi:endonuclease YncB( thermonuclease family)
VILPEGINLNQELVKQGWCWWYRKHASGDAVLEELEKAAQKERKGLWADPQPVPPWEWRKLKKLSANQYHPHNPASPMNRSAFDVPCQPVPM